MDPQPHIRGVRFANHPASLGVRMLALIVDLVWITGAIALVFQLTATRLFPSVALLVGWMVGLALIRLAQQSLFTASLGQFIWRIQLVVPGTLQSARGMVPWRAQVYQRERLVPGKIVTGIFLTLILGAGSYRILDEAALGSPAFRMAMPESLAATAPQGPQWIVLPFFYSIGAWPRSFDHHSIFYALPYEKGPPARFVGHITADWEHPEIKVTIEGPRTPEVAAKPDELKSCFMKTGVDLLLNRRCQKVRRAALEPQLAEMRQLETAGLRFTWFEVDNPALMPEERPRGFALLATTGNRVQARYVLVNPQGAHQAFILDRPKNEVGETAEQLFEEALRSQRLSDQLSMGRAWIDRALSSVQLQSIDALKGSPDLADRITEIQGMLLSKISVDPQTLDSYYHLGGTAYVLAMRGLKEHNLDWVARARPLLQASIRYAEDVNPTDPRSSRLRELGRELSQR